MAQLLALFNDAAIIDMRGEGTSAAELERMLRDPLLDLANDVRLWKNEHQQLVGFGSLLIASDSVPVDASLDIVALPLALVPRLEARILRWGEARITTLAQEQQVPYLLSLNVRDDDPDYRIWFEDQGYRPLRRFVTMERSLAIPVPAAIFPASFTWRCIDGERDAAAWVELYNDTFLDHWNHHPLTLERFLYELQAPHYDPAFDVVALAPGGTMAAFCYGYVDHEENRRAQTNEGWLIVLGTRRGYRKRGLGQALLRCVLQRMREAGVQTANLNVDALNETGAIRLYQTEGFRPVVSRTVYGKQFGQ